MAASLALRLMASPFFLCRSLDCVFENLSVLHDQCQIFFRLSQDRDVFERIAADEQQVGIRTFFNNPKLTWVWVTLIGEC